MNARLLPAVAIMLLLAACAGQRSYREGTELIRHGQVDSGLARLEDAVRAEPGNAEYRIGLARERATALQRMLATAETARREERFDDAQNAYRAVLKLDPNQPMAQQGLALLAQTQRHRALVAEAEELFRQGGVQQAGAALDRLRAVLSADPRHRGAQKLKEQIEDARTREGTGSTAVADAFRRPITLQFSDAPLKAIFDAISRISGLNFYFDRDVRPDARGTILARSTTVEDAVRLLLLTNQLELKVVDDSSVLVYPNTPQKQKDYQTLVVRSFFLANADVKAVSNAIKTIVKTKDLVVDERLGTILMRDTAEAVRVAERIVALQDMADPEVMLEVEVLEIKRSKLQELGLQWPGQLTLSPLPTNGDSTTLADLRGLRASAVKAQLSSAAVNVNQQDQDANILTNPRIRVRNKEKAKVLIGDRIPVITTTTSGTASFLTESVSYVDVGLKLEVEPTVHLDDDVGIKVGLEVSSLVREVISKNGTLTYQIGTRGASTALRLKDGETQILAGLISDEERASGNKVPGLGDLPVLGRLFGSRKEDDQRSEILLSITPHVLRSLMRPPLANAEFESGTESAVGVPTPRLRRAESTGDPRANGPKASVGPGTPNATPAMPAPGVLPPSGPPVAAASPLQARTPQAGFASTPAQGLSAASPRLQWQGPTQVRAGQGFTLLLRGTGVGNWHQLTLDIGFDPQLFQLTELRAGQLFDPADGNGALLRQGEGNSGRLQLTLSRPEVPEAPAGARTSAGGPTDDILILGFKALRAGTAGALTLRQAEPRPTAEAAISLPLAHSVNILP